MFNNFDSWFYFSSPIYMVNKPEFLASAKKISYELLDSVKKEQVANDIYPLYNTNNFDDHEDVKDLSKFILDMSWDILDSQGYDMRNFGTFMDDFWCQEHQKHSGHERHIHGSMLSGFYFLDCPENSCRLVIHEPRPVKEYVFLPEKNTNDITYASKMVNFTPNPGMLVFTNSWLPHSFTKNESNEPFRMIHFDVTARYIGDHINYEPSQATII